MLLSAVMCAKPLRHRNVNIKLYMNQIYVITIIHREFEDTVNINYRLPIKVYYRICTLRHIRIEINHGSQNVF
jgi:hypothetical protein